MARAFCGAPAVGTVGRDLLRLIRSTLVALAITVAGVAALPASAAASTSGEYLGLNLQPLMKDPAIAESRWPSFLQHLPAGRMSISRLDVNWQWGEPVAPKNGVHTYEWNYTKSGLRYSIDHQMAQMAAQGIRAAPTFTAPPRWVWGPNTRLPEDKFVDFADFIVAFSARYGPGGAFWAAHPELPALPTVDYEIWNEANSTNFWTQPQDPAAYGRLLNVLYPKLKAQQPGAQVLASLGWENGGGYLDGVWAAGAGGSLDAIGYHPYAPTAMAITSLVTGLRDKLRALGRPDMPIMVTETGQPATYVGPGAVHAYDGHVSDSARAATQSFAADALARSDCGVGQFLVYAATGTETDKEIISEGFMGVLRYADGTPNATGAALQRASKRWADAIDAGTALQHGRLLLCSPEVTPEAALLPLGLSVERSGNTCVIGTTTYDGNPLEGAELVLTTTDGRKTVTGPDAFGKSEACLGKGPPVSEFYVRAQVPETAASVTFKCDLPVNGPCLPRVATPPPPVCTVKLLTDRPRKATATKKVRGKATTVKTVAVKVRATLQCPAFKSTYVKTTKKKVRVLVKGKYVWKTKTTKKTLLVKPVFIVSHKPKAKPAKKGKKAPKAPKERKLRTLKLIDGKKITFTVKGPFKKGDQITLLHKLAPKKDKLPKVKVASTLKAPKAAKKAPAKKK